MGIHLRISAQTLAVLEALLDRPAAWHHGYAISRHTGISSGTLYPIFMRLEKLGWLEARWEDAAVRGRPPRHLYRLSGEGRAFAREELSGARARGFQALRPAGDEV